MTALEQAGCWGHLALYKAPDHRAAPPVCAVRAESREIVTMVRLSLLPPLLLVLLGAAAGIQIEMYKEQMVRLRRIMNSEVVQLLAERLDLTLPAVPDLSVDPQNADINALLTQAGSIGCVPEGVQVPDDVSAAIRACGRQAVQAAKRTPLLPPRRQQAGGTAQRPRRRNQQRRNQQRRTGRSLVRSIMRRAENRAMQVGLRCVLNRLQLLGDTGELNQTAVETLIDGMTASDEFKSQKKNLTALCISSTPEEINDTSQRLEYQLDCIGALNKLECMLGVADGVSPTAGFMARVKHGECLTKGLEPPPRAVQAKALCVSEQVSAMMRARLDETETTATGRRRRRRRNADELMSLLRQMTSLESLERAVTSPPRCRPTLLRKCPPQVQRMTLSAQEVNETLSRAEAVLGPLDEVLASMPDRAIDIATCWHGTMGTVDADGAIDMDALQAVLEQFRGPELLTVGLQAVVGTCDATGATGSADEFSRCFINRAPLACALLQTLADTEGQMTATG